MTKDTFYFPHDAGSRHDPKIRALIKDYGIEGYGMFWSVIEIMFEQTDKMLQKFPRLFSGIADDLDLEEAQIKQFFNDCINEYWLFDEDDEFIWSPSLLRRMEIRENKRLKKVEAGRIGGKRSGASRNRSGASQNEAKERKGKERKGKEIKGNKKKEKEPSAFVVDVVNYLNQVTGKSFSPNTPLTIQKITARQNSGYTLDQFKAVVDIKAEEWLHNDEMNKYLRPETLFSEKFDSYLNQGKKTKSNLQKFEEMVGK